ncbi:hypothetical protein [Burkholderia ubonensis]|nr:hypothetical protein [Burkholderia ubonensis]PAJ84326.1 hypothetical protein CJO70_28565 [Burkholderia ubonensis]PAJ98670.1 hypothetical protein CJO68_23730 [Burkholderia ubonensis]PAK04438.1 hypothetical protein CJO67_29260 [Burkholderia ubonensis]RQP65534.1 hypothetical protein DF013_34215 [Burkholderia ubonensis]RQP69558.1 hypothetical protein DF014_35245 [Burkholderia ubonensis]
MAQPTNRFADYQASLVETHLTRIKAELKDIGGRSRPEFKDLDSLVKYVAKVTGLHRTTLKRNVTYRKVLRDFLAQQPGAASLVAVDDASPELLRATVEEQRLTIANLTAQIKALNARFAQLDTKGSELTSLPAPSSSNSHSRDEVAFHDTALALWQLIQHLNQTAGVESIVLDEEAGVIIDAAIPNPRKRREMAIGPERTKSFMAWYAANKELLKI